MKICGIRHKERSFLSKKKIKLQFFSSLAGLRSTWLVPKRVDNLR